MPDAYFSVRWDQDRCVLQLQGRLQAGDVTGLARSLCDIARGQGADRVEVSFAHCAGELDLTLPALLGALREQPDAPTVDLTGLTQHHVRLLGYLGFEDAGDAPGK